MERVKEHKKSISLVVFFTLIAQLSVGCKMVAVPKGPWRKKERIIRREPLKETEVLGRTLEVNRVKEEKCKSDASCLSKMRKLNRWGIIGLRLTARLECERKWREVYFVEQIRDFKVHGCRGTASFLCTILPATIITAILGVPLLAYGAKKLGRAGGHDPNAVGIIAAGGTLVGAGLAGVFSCPISKMMERRCNRMKRRFRRGEPERRVVKEAVGDCGRELLKDTTVLVGTKMSRKPIKPGSNKVKKPNGAGADGTRPLGPELLYGGVSSPLSTTLKTNRDAEVMVDLMYLMAQRGMKRPPERIIVSINTRNDDDVGVQLSSAIMEVGEDLRRGLVSATRRETLALKVASDKEPLRRILRDFPENVRYRIIELTCSEKLRIVLMADSRIRLPQGGHKGKIWFESRLRRGNQQENPGKEQVQVGKEQVQVGKEQVQVGKEQVQVGKEQVQVGKEQNQVGKERDHGDKEKDLENGDPRKKAIGGKTHAVRGRGVPPAKSVSFLCSPQTSTWIYLLAPPEGRQAMGFEWRAERAD